MFVSVIWCSVLCWSSLMTSGLVSDVGVRASHPWYSSFFSVFPSPRPVKWHQRSSSDQTSSPHALAPSPDILLLDEPTNHLDLPGIGTARIRRLTPSTYGRLESGVRKDGICEAWPYRVRGVADLPRLLTRLRRFDP